MAKFSRGGLIDFDVVEVLIARVFGGSVEIAAKVPRPTAELVKTSRESRSSSYMGFAQLLLNDHVGDVFATSLGKTRDSNEEKKSTFDR